jgi:hypothetical protein
MSFDLFIETGWNDHADHPHEVADRLAASLGVIETPAHIAPYARLVTHVYGEHLGEWTRGIALLESLRALPQAGGAAEAAALGRSLAALRYCSGDRSVIAGFATEDSITVLATASSAFAGLRDHSAAIAAYEDALQRAAGGLPDKSPALRALAIGGNNLAAALETKPARTPQESLGMLAAADGGVRYWRRAGTWLEEERAYYRLARSQLATGLAEAAAASALRCLAVCAEHDAPAFERFFGYAVLGMAQRAAQRQDAAAEARTCALAEYARVPEAERKWCAADLAELGA